MGRVKETQSKVNKAKESANSRKRRSLIRIKMPNFEAIHKKRFKQMESILDHVERKAERAKELSKSTVKKSIKKASTNINTPTRELANNVNENELKILKGCTDGIPKARQKINFTSDDNKITKMKDKESCLEKTKINSKTIASTNSTVNKKGDSKVSRQKSAKNVLANENKQPKTNNKIEVLKDTNILENKKTEYVKKIRVNRTFELKMAHRNIKK